MENFAETVQGAAVGSDTKKVVNAASKGDLEEYKKALDSYSWPRTRDYTMVLLIFSPIVAAMNAISKMDKSDDKFNDLAPLVDTIVTRQYMVELCDYIGQGNGKKIKNTLNAFSEYKTLLQKLSGNKYGCGTSDKFTERAGKISRWVKNGEYLSKYLGPFIQGTLGSKFASKITNGIAVYSHHIKNPWYLRDENGDDLIWDDLKIYPKPSSKNEEYQHMSSERREIIVDNKIVIEARPGVGLLPSRVKITAELRNLFNRFGEPLEQKFLYITETKLYDKLRIIITTKIANYKDLDDVSKVYEK